jgi:hypothetical protein
MNAMTPLSSRGRTWFHALADGAPHVDLTIRLNNAEAKSNRAALPPDNPQTPEKLPSA